MLILALLLQAAPPSERAVALGRQVAESGTLATLLPMMIAKETDELVAAHPELDTAGQVRLRRIAAEQGRAGTVRLFDAEARAYARVMTEAELTQVVTFNTSAAAIALRRALPVAIAAAMGAMQGLDFKKDVMAAFCKETGSGEACAK